MSKLLKSVVAGLATGAAAAYIFGTKKGQEMTEKVSDFITDYKGNPDSYHEAVREKATAYKDLAVDTFNDYKEKFATGEVTPKDLVDAAKEKVNQVVDVASEKVVAVKDQLKEEDLFMRSKDKSFDEEVTPKEDIIITLKDTEDR